MTTQADWRWCKKCQGLAFVGSGVIGVCAAGGKHDHAGSGNYMLVYNEPAAEGQNKWCWCKKCQGLAFSGSGSPGVCPAGGKHDHAGSGDYKLRSTSSLLSSSQNNWRWCKKCQGLAFSGSGSGKCPAGEGHDFKDSGDYSLDIAEPLTIKIDAIMRENTPDGYRFVVCNDKNILGSGVGGFSRMAVDPPEVPARIDDRPIIASMSKTITAIAVLNTLQAKNLSPDTPIEPFLPPDWKLHDEVKKLTFRDFMTHRTGFFWDGKTAFQDATDYEGMKKILAQKPLNPIKAGYSYRNLNFAIFRVVLPYLDAYDRFTKKVLFPVVSGTPLDVVLAKRYIEIVNQRVLAPSGVAPAACDSKTIITLSGPKEVRYSVLAYRYQKPSQKGIDAGDQTLYCGASGWALSVVDIAKVLQTALFTEVVLSEKSRALLLAPGPLENRGCGMNMDSVLAGSNVYSHGAWIPFEQGAPIDGAQLAGWYIYFEKIKMIVVALSNAGHKPGVANWYDRVKQAYVEVYGSS